MTFAENFVKSNFYIAENRRHSYLLLRTTSRDLLHTDPKTWLLPGLKKNYRVDEENGIISIELRVRFANAIASAGDNIPRIFIQLNQALTENAIKTFFHSVWVAHNNVKVRKANTTAFCQRRRVAKLMSGVNVSNRKDHQTIRHITTSMSMMEAAKSSRVFT